MIIHHNIWKWGDTYTIIRYDGKAKVEVTISNDEPEVAYINGLSVYEPQRGKGYGKIMLEDAIAQANKIGCKYAYLHCDKDSFVFDWYKQRGFQYFGDKPNENGFVPMYVQLDRLSHVQL